MRYFFQSIFLCSFTIGIAFTCAPLVHAQAQLSIPNITPYWIVRQPYNTSTALVLSKGGKGSTSAQDSSFFSIKNLAIIPPVLGGLSILAGSLFTWINSRKKLNLFKEYMSKVDNATKVYRDTKGNTEKSKKKSLEEVRELFVTLQEQVDLSVANKEIDEEQGKTIAHTVQRKLLEIEKEA